MISKVQLTTEIAWSPTSSEDAYWRIYKFHTLHAVIMQ